MYLKQLTVLALPLHIFLEEFFDCASFFSCCNSINVAPQSFFDVVYLHNILFNRRERRVIPPILPRSVFPFCLSISVSPGATALLLYSFPNPIFLRSLPDFVHPYKTG